MRLRFSDSDDDAPHRPRGAPDGQFDSPDSVFVVGSDSESDLPERVFQVPRGPSYESGTFRFSVSSQLTVRGLRTHYQFSQEGYPLFHSKSKSWSPSAPIGISFGSSSHVSQAAFIAVVIPGAKRRTFTVKQGEADVMQIEFSEVKGPHPKRIRISIDNQVFVNQQPKLGLDGHWQLSFGGKLAIPSVKNCVIVPENDSGTVVMQMRRVSGSNCELDSAGMFAPICLFGYAIASFVSPI
jgi:hypothetical protein